MSLLNRAWSAFRSAFHPRRRTFAEQLAKLEWENRQLLDQVAALEAKLAEAIRCPRMLVTSSRPVPPAVQRKREAAFAKALESGEMSTILFSEGLDVWQLVDGEWRPLKIERSNPQPPPADLPPAYAEYAEADHKSLTADQLEAFRAEFRKTLTRNGSRFQVDPRTRRPARD
ncbi:hypothetical protein [Singulisphaera sp. PoT]|uniref:hypothetical protein n=1 Tax=Singulisphaera sp. PoT TaxID=3411797 RepID=UPI003BF5F8B4